MKVRVKEIQNCGCSANFSSHRM